MKLLLDSQAFLWWRDAPERFSRTTFREIGSADNSVFISIASIWELQLKIMLKKLKMVDSLEFALDVEAEKNGFSILTIEVAHITTLKSLPPIHKDPFDRMLISQSIYEGMSLVTSDRVIREYEVDVIW